MAQAVRDQNHITSLLLESSSTAGLTINAKGDESTGRLLVDNAGGGSGTVTSVSVVSANGFAGTVATATTTPAITLSTTINSPVLAGNGTAISAATTTGSGSTVVLQNTPTLTTPVIGAATGTSLSVSGLLSSATGLTLEETGAGSDTITLQAPASITASYTLTLPVDDGASGEVLSTNGSGVLSWVSAGGVPTTITVADESSDTTCFLGFFTAATGDLGPKTNANLPFNSSTGVLTLTAPILGTPTSGTLTNCTGLPISSGVSGLGAGIATFLATPSSANLATAVTDETGSGSLVFGTSPTLGGTVVVDTMQTSGAQGIILKNSGGTSILTVGPANGTGISTAGQVNFGSSAVPTTTDVGALGAAGNQWADLFLAEGGVINFDNGDVTVTQTGNVLAVAGGDLRVATADVGTNADSVPTLSSTSTLTNKTLTAPKFANGGFIADANGNEEIIFNTTASAVNEVAITNAATGTTGPLIAASGETNVDLRIAGKGTGQVHHTTAIYGDLTAASDGATITFDVSDSNIQTVTLGGNRTLAISNAAVGQCFMLRLLQDGTGSRTVTWFTTIKWAGGAAPTLTTTANKADMLGFVVTSAGNYDGFVVGQNI